MSVPTVRERFRGVWFSEFNPQVSTELIQTEIQNLMRNHYIIKYEHNTYEIRLSDVRPGLTRVVNDATPSRERFLNLITMVPYTPWAMREATETRIRSVLNPGVDENFWYRLTMYPISGEGFQDYWDGEWVCMAKGHILPFTEESISFNLNSWILWDEMVVSFTTRDGKQVFSHFNIGLLKETRLERTILPAMFVSRIHANNNHGHPDVEYGDIISIAGHLFTGAELLDERYLSTRLFDSTEMVEFAAFTKPTYIMVIRVISGTNRWIIEQSVQHHCAIFLFPEFSDESRQYSQSNLDLAYKHTMELNLRIISSLSELIVAGAEAGQAAASAVFTVGGLMDQTLIAGKDVVIEAAKVTALGGMIIGETVYEGTTGALSFAWDVTTAPISMVGERITEIGEIVAEEALRKYKRTVFLIEVSSVLAIAALIYYLMSKRNKAG